MNRQFFLHALLVFHFFLAPPLQATLTETEEADLQKIITHSNLLTPEIEPHVYDAQIPTWTQELTTLFPKIIKRPLPSYEIARTWFLQGAQQFDAINPDHKTVFGNTYHAMLMDRLVSPANTLPQATQTLLCHAMAATPQENDLLALVGMCNPSNASASAVYNVFFKWTVNQLQTEHHCQKEEEAPIQALNSSLQLHDHKSLQEGDEDFYEEETPLDSSYQLDPACIWKSALRTVCLKNPSLVPSLLKRFKENTPDAYLIQTFNQWNAGLNAKEATAELADLILVNALS